MTDVEHEVFLLMLALSRTSDEGRLRALFLDAMNAALPGVSLRYAPEPDPSAGEVLEIRTASTHYGYIALSGDRRALPSGSLSVLRNAVGMLAVMLERSRHLRQVAEDGRRALREREESFADAERIARIGLWDWDIVRDRITQSKQAEVNLASPAPVVSFDDLSAQIHPADRASVAESFRRSVERSETLRCTFRIRPRAGPSRTILVVGEVIPDPTGAPIRIRGVCQDVTEQAELQQELAQSQKLESIGRLAGGVAHDFNNMLAVILAQAELGLCDVGATHPLRANLLEIRGAAERSADLTRQLLAFARKQTIAPRVLDLNATVSDMLKIMRRLIGEDIELTWKPGPGLWSVKMDPAQVDQILANLCVNARDAISGVGGILIATENATLDEEYCATHTGCAPGEFVVLRVEDTGCGMDGTVLDHVFEPFYTTKPVGQGTGLGLATVYGTVKQNEGFIRVESEPGKGTSFEIYLPRFAGTAVEASIPGPREMPRGRGETVLLVEDDQGILRSGKAMLEQLGYSVLAASTPNGAIRLAEGHGTPIELLITDVIMPEMDGRELAGRVKELHARVKCLYISGYTADVIAHRGVLEKGVAFLEKPFSLEALATKTREALHHLPRPETGES